MLPPVPTPDIPLRLLVEFGEAFPDDSPAFTLCAPGRDVWLAAVENKSDHFALAAPDFKGKVTFSLQSARQKRSVWQRPLPRWAYYAAGVTLVMDNAGVDALGMNIVVLGDEPPGPSYDFGVGLVFAALWHALRGQAYTLDSLADWVEAARREYVEAD
jgi:hypothetical protein